MQCLGARFYDANHQYLSPQAVNLDKVRYIDFHRLKELQDIEPVSYTHLMCMIILPAMDLLDGKPVRLYQGDYKRKESVGDDAFLIARQFKAAGASYLQLVDLNGAKMGKPCNFALIQKIVAEIGIPVEVGGGIRTSSDIERYLQCGAKRIILGTAALENPSFLKEALCRYGDRLAAVSYTHLDVYKRQDFILSEGKDIGGFALCWRAAKVSSCAAISKGG